MKKTLRFSLLSLLLMVCGMAMAEKVTILPSDFTAVSTSDYSTTKDGVTVAVTSSTVTGDQMRIFKNQSITISSTAGNMSKIVFTCTAAGTEKYGPGCFAAQEGYSFEGTKGTWSGDAASVTFTASSNQVRVTQIDVTIGQDGENPDPDPEPTVTEGQTAETAINVTRALAIIDALADGAKTSESYYVKGQVKAVAEISVKYGNATFTIADAGSEAVLTAFRVMGLENKKFMNVDALQDGDEVVVYGMLQKYVSGETKTAQIAQSGGYVYSINGKTKDDTPNPEDAITKGLTAEAPMTADEAIAYINAFTDGFTTEKQYYVKGKVTALGEYNEQYKNITFNMGDLIAFRMKGLENKEIKSADFLKADDEVVVLAKLQKYMDNNVAKPELSTGYIYSLNGKTKDDTPVEPVTFVGDGTETNPYTVGDLGKMTEEIFPADDVWVKGFIAGFFSSITKLAEGDKIGDSNIAIAETADGTTYVPVNLPYQTEFRTKLNVKDTPANIGKEVKLLGKIIKYFGVAGVKELKSAIINGETISGIAEVKAEQLQGKMFNLQGQRVARGYKGIMIQNGKKVLVK